MKSNLGLILGMAMALGLLACACSSSKDDDNPGTGSDAGSDGNASADADTDADTDTDTDADADADGGGDVDGDVDGDADGDGDAATDSGTDDYAQHFERFTVNNTNKGPAFVTVVDIDGDDLLEIIVSYFGPMTDLQMRGSVMIYDRTDSGLDAWTGTAVVAKTDGIHFPNKVQAYDVDGDTDLDLVVPSGFLACGANPLVGACGGLSWWENTGSGWARHDIVAVGSDLFYHHAEFVDINNDTKLDMISVGEKKPVVGQSLAEVHLFLGNDTPERFATTPIVLGSGLGSIPEMYDVDGDGDLDILSAEYFANNATNVSFAWFEQTGAPDGGTPGGTWQRRVIANDLGTSIQLSLVPDFFSGDSDKIRLIGSNHTNTLDDTTAPESQVVVFEGIPADPTGLWPYRKISTGMVSRKSPATAPQGSPGVFAWGDVDDDDDIDVVVSGDGDPRVFVLEQTTSGQFATHPIATGMGQAGIGEVTDLDGDGKNEIVASSYEAGVVYIYKWND